MLSLVLIWCLSLVLLEFWHHVSSSALVGLCSVALSIFVWILLASGLELLGLTLLVVYAAVFLLLLIVSLGLTGNSLSSFLVTINSWVKALSLLLVFLLATAMSETNSSSLLATSGPMFSQSWTEVSYGASSAISSSILSVIHALLFSFFWVEGILLNLLLFVGFSCVLLSTSLSILFSQTWTNNSFSSTLSDIGAQASSNSIWSSSSSNFVKYN